MTISLDDFGSGYSSLAQLRSLPFDRLKIDRSFVTAMPDSRDSTTIVQAITSLGQGLGLPITAEGVENIEVAQQLRGMGQFTAQGYHYGRPEPADLTRERLALLGMLKTSGPAQPEKKPALDVPPAPLSGAA